MIAFDHVTRAYGRNVAVDDLSFTVRPGELFALLGPNGAGKTTTIKMLVGLLRPDAGSIRIRRLDVVERPRQAIAALGYVPDEPFLYDKLSGRELLEFSAEMRGLDPRAVQEAVAGESARFELSGFLDALIETYSHGMRQRLEFAAALLHAPDVLVIDEPMVGLDPRSVRLVKDLLRGQADRGASVLMSTHTLAVAEEIADRIGIVNHGRLEFLGTVEDLRRALAAPHHTLEALFLELTEQDGDGDGHPGAASPSASPPEVSEPSEP